jgi:hypothetical protein
MRTAALVAFVVVGWTARWMGVEGNMDWLTAEKVDLILKLVGGLVLTVGGFVCLRLLPALAEYKRVSHSLGAAELVTAACKVAASAAAAALASGKPKEEAMETGIQAAVAFLAPHKIDHAYSRGQVVDAIKTYMAQKGIGANP